MFLQTVFFITLFTVVTSTNLTFQDVTVQCQTTDLNELTIQVTSSSLKDALPTEQITRITIIGDSTIPVLHRDAVANLTHLKILQIRQHGVEKILPGAFSNLPLLAILRLSGNKLKRIEEGVFNNLQLSTVNLDHNLIETISPKAFDNLTKLQVLDLSNNHLRDFRGEWLADKPALSFVSFAYNKIDRLPDGSLADYHRAIDFNNNQIGSISRLIFGDLKKGANLDALWLADNLVEKWDPSFLGNVTVRDLDLSRNKLECLEGNYEEFFGASRTRLMGNPWKCDCLLEMAKWVLKTKTKRVDLSADNCVGKTE